METDNVDFAVGDWVAIKDSYRNLDGADRSAFYGQIMEVHRQSNGDVLAVYKVHCNNDNMHYLFANEVRLLPRDYTTNIQL